MDMNQFGEAAEHLSAMLHLNPGDNQGNRYLLAQCLLNSNQLDALDTLLNSPLYNHDASPEWAFTRALLAYRRAGDGPEARQRLEEAGRQNPFVVPLLTGNMPASSRLPQTYQMGSEEEAIICVEQIAQGWHETSGAIEWLQSASAKPRPKSSKPQSPKRKKRK
jgi:tetratricopeptide (TPR) repeat protein